MYVLICIILNIKSSYMTYKKNYISRMNMKSIISATK